MSTLPFIGTRCRLSRHKDAKFVNGWVTLFKGESVCVATEDPLGSEPGDAFYLEAYGPKSKACAPAVLRLIEPGEGEAKLTFQLTGHVKVVDNAEPTRVLVNRMHADVSCSGSSFRAQVRDVSIKGVGLVTEQALSKGAEVEMTIGTSLGPIAAKGVVRHVREQNGKYRVGVELTGLSRLDGSRWKRLLGEAA